MTGRSLLDRHTERSRSRAQGRRWTKDEWHLQIANLIYECRNSRGMTQQELADRVGYSRVSIVNIEAGRQYVGTWELHLFARALNVWAWQLPPDLGRV